MSVVDAQRVAEIIREVAMDKIVPRFQRLAAHEIRSKSSPNDLATIADDEAEIELTRILKDLLPGSLVVGEEAVSSGDISRDILKDKNATVWVIDPVDGTGNFANGKPIFGTMVALIKNGERVGSWIYQIPTDRMVIGQKGAGITIAGIPYERRDAPEGNVDFLRHKAFVSRKFIPPYMRPFVDEQVSHLQDVSTHMCCAWEYVELLEGLRLFSVYKRIEPWDHLAGVMLLEEAGYYIRKWDGSIYDPADQEGGLVNAPSEEIWERAHRMFVSEPIRKASLSGV
jgi:fructose-1,6-bisphosphatase/inositol monophosphatase family enzyme